MDQDAYRKTYQEINERFCAFEKGILTNQCRCSEVEKLSIAEREAAHCNSDEGQKNCIQFLAVLKEHARFALKLHGEIHALPHAKAIRLQIGGLRGLQTVVTNTEQTEQIIPDISGLIQQALDKFSSLEALPFSDIMQQVAAYQGRKSFRSKR